MRLVDISFKKKIFLLLVFPILGFLGIGINSILSSIETNNEMEELTKYTALSSVYSELVHELQKERAATAGFLTSKGLKFSNKLPNQRKLTSEKLKKRSAYWQSNKFDGNNIQQLNSKIEHQLNQLMQIRKAVDEFAIATPDAISFYTKTNALLLSVSSITAEISANSEITKATGAYYDFIQGKERAGIERAVLTTTFASDAFAQGMYEKFITLVAEQNTYFAGFSVFANDKNRNTYQQGLNAPAIKEVAKLRSTAKKQASSGGFNVDPNYWFEQSTKRINILKNIEDEISHALLAHAQEIKNSAFKSLIYNLVSSIIMLLLVMVTSFYVVKGLHTQVTDLTAVMAKVNDDNDLTARAKYVGKSELGTVSIALNSTLERFSGAMSEISTSSKKLASAADETSDTCILNSQSLIEQQDEIGVIATAIEQLSATVKEVAGNTQLTADSAKEADGQAKSGTDVVQKSYHSIEKLAVEINNLAEKITSLHQSSNNITNVVDVIKSVAEQTNLLALNAAIEAARAGDQGRGFAVVADEVRTLAQRTQESTIEIENFISVLQTDANSAFEVIDNSQKMAEHAVGNSKDVEQALGEITNSVSNIFAMTEQVSVAIEEQATVTDDVAQSVINIEQKSQESTNGSAQITATAKEQAMLAAELKNIAVIYKVS